MAKGASWAASVAAAVVMPLVVVALSLAGMESLRSFADRRENRNAGKVINGKVAEGGVVAVIENTLDLNRPDVIILGNSLSNTDILPPLLAQRLGIKKHKVQRFSIPNSIGAHWYAILKNRVYANGHRPPLVIILSDMQSALAVTPRSEASYLNLSVHLSEYEPVINERLGERNYTLERVRQNRGKVREKALEGARNAMVDLLWFHRLTPSDGKKTERALERVFDSSRTDMRLHNNVIPIFATGKKLQPFDPSELPRPKDSFLPEITQLVAENGGTVVYLRPPMSPLLPAELGDVVLPEVEPVAIDLVRQLGGHYLDTRSLPLAATHFHNVDHMNAEGARAYTEAVARVLPQLPGLEVYRPRRGHEVDLLRFVDELDGVVAPHEPAVVYRTEPPPLPRAQRPVQGARKGIAFVTTESFAFLSDLSTVDNNPAARRCSPIRVLEDGEPLRLGNVACEEVQKHKKGRYCHTEERIYFSASDESSPAENGRTYTLDLDPNRSCYGSQWLYPEDRLRLEVTPEELATFQRPIRSLTLRAFDRSSQSEAPATWLKVTVRANDRVRLEEVVSVDRLAEPAGVTFAFEPPLGGQASDVHVEVANESAVNFVLLTTARLSDAVVRGE